jgi:hypothetical protein
MSQAKEQDLFKTTCVKMVEDAAAILAEMEGTTGCKPVRSAAGQEPD